MEPAIRIDPDVREVYPFDSQFLNIDGRRYHYIDQGSGPPMVMVHGNPTWSFYYRHLIQTFGDRFRTVAMDHMGCGLSDKPHPRDYAYTLAQRVSDLERLMTHLDLQEITLVVHDWGGMIGLAWALRNLARIRRVVILNTTGFSPPRGKPIPWQLKAIRNLPWLAAPAVLGGNLFARAAIHMAARRPLNRIARKGLLAPYDRWSHRWATLRFVQDIPLTPADPSFTLVNWVDRHLDRLADLPMLICWGAHDFVFDLDYLDEWRQRFPMAQTHLIEQAGHYVLEDAPLETARYIETFCETTTMP